MPENSAQPQVVSTQQFNWKRVGWITITVIIIIIVIAAFWWFFLRPKEEPTTVVNRPPTKTSTPSATPSAKPATPSAKKDGTQGWKTYTSKTFKYSIKYPPNWPLYKSEGSLSGTPVEQVYLNRNSNKPLPKGKPSITIIGNFQGGWCEGDGGFTKVCEFDEVEIDGVIVKRQTIIENGDEVYQLKLEADFNIILFATPANQKDLVHKIISTFKFLD